MDIQTVIALLFADLILSLILASLLQVDRFDIFNPVANYHEWTEMNWFGVILFTLIINIISPVISVCYWFWKLCTVGRKE